MSGLPSSTNIGQVSSAPVLNNVPTQQQQVPPVQPNPSWTGTMAPAQQTLKCQCTHCKVNLSYPSHSLFIQCPRCSRTMNPRTPHTNYINCIGCGTLLSHPPTSLTIQCPQCLVVMELRRQLSLPPLEMIQNTSTTNRKSKKKRKDPNAPKRASNSYMIFCKNKRRELKMSNPELSFGHLGSQLGIMWRNLSDADKKPYEDSARADKERYNDEMKVYLANPGKPVGGNATTDGATTSTANPHKKAKVQTEASSSQPVVTPNAFEAAGQAPFSTSTTTTTTTPPAPAPAPAPAPTSTPAASQQTQQVPALPSTSSEAAAL